MTVITHKYIGDTDQTYKGCDHITRVEVVTENFDDTITLIRSTGEEIVIDKKEYKIEIFV